MFSVYESVKSLEQLACRRYGLTEGLMIENAAAALEREVCAHAASGDGFVLILCGSGNNGADGYALSRRITGVIPSAVYCAAEAETAACKEQAAMAASAGVSFISRSDFLQQLLSCTVAVDCLYGTGFHGPLDGGAASLIQSINTARCFRIACDIPSGLEVNGTVPSVCGGLPLAFNADVTVTMGARKSALYGDAAKNFCGTVHCADIGVSSVRFQTEKPDAYLLAPSDMKLPVRTDRSVHKGSFGHAVVVAGEKEGAAVIAGTAALTFGAGLVTVVDTVLNRPASVALSPELMYGTELPEGMTAVLLGSGLGRSDYRIADTVWRRLSSAEASGIVLDADMFYYGGIMRLLDDLAEKYPDVQTVLTPHPKEFQSLLQLCAMGTHTVRQLADDRLSFVRLFSQRFPRAVLVLKGANTFVSSGPDIFISTEGCQCLAKAGSGDVLAGVICALLAQGYSAADAAVTGVLAHGTASRRAPDSYSMTPFRLIEALSQLAGV